MDRPERHIDCFNYAPLDVAKGICHVKKHVILADEGACDAFERLPRCRHCRHYSASHEAHVGTCCAEISKPMTYPELTGVTCRTFDWKERPAK